MPAADDLADHRAWREPRGGLPALLLV